MSNETLSGTAPFEIQPGSYTHAILEVFGGDNNLNDFVEEDLQEMAAGIGPSVIVIALADFYGHEAAVVEVTAARGCRVVESWGEIDTGDPEILAHFLARALSTCAGIGHLAIGFWDHGSGVFDEHDPNEVILERRLRSVTRHRRAPSRAARRLFISRGALASKPRLRAMLHDDTNGGVLTNVEAKSVIAAAFSRAGRTAPVDIIFSDTCLNGMVEVLDQFKDFALAIVASEDLEPGDGWDYTGWFQRMAAAPAANADAWAQQAVEAFHAGYDGQFGAYPCTLGAFRSRHAMSEAFAALLRVCDSAGPSAFDALRAARDQSQAFANRDTYDIRDFGIQLQAVTSDAAIRSAAQSLIDAFDAAYIKHAALGSQVEQSNGLAFWFPNNRYAFNLVKETYRELEFSKATGWTDYLQLQF
ncbi:MAG: hypothetical protein HYV27_00825 [Candidatus Hydrogenedentes bacterium]|nr:hypothetical protein [Candidatus Hydrogenedentota bacterium]